MPFEATILANLTITQTAAKRTKAVQQGFPGRIFNKTENKEDQPKVAELFN